MTFLKRFKIRDLKFNNVDPRIAYALIIVGMIHFIPNGVAIAKLQRVAFYNWGIYADLGLPDSLQLPLMYGILIFDALISFFGVYLLKHLEPEQEKKKNDFNDKDNLV